MHETENHKNGYKQNAIEMFSAKDEKHAGMGHGQISTVWQNLSGWEGTISLRKDSHQSKNIVLEVLISSMEALLTIIPLNALKKSLHRECTDRF